VAGAVERVMAARIIGMLLLAGRVLIAMQEIEMTK
jgi:hypothetical protein